MQRLQDGGDCEVLHAVVDCGSRLSSGRCFRYIQAFDGLWQAQGCSGIA